MSREARASCHISCHWAVFLSCEPLFPPGEVFGEHVPLKVSEVWVEECGDLKVLLSVSSQTLQTVNKNPSK